ncbi:MAG: ABC transporter, ATP-binding protein (cluster 10, nitrate/sulfonate/bicarbonate), partial [uncultured Quadrisphaera sp.]
VRDQRPLLAGRDVRSAAPAPLRPGAGRRPVPALPRAGEDLPRRHDGAAGGRPRRRARRLRHRRRPLGVREVHAAAHRLRPGAPQRGGGAGQRGADRLRLPGRHPAALAHGGPQRRAARRAAPPPARGDPPGRGRGHRAGGAGRARAEAARRPLRGDADAGLAGPLPGARAAAVPLRRAVRRPRRDHPRAPRRRAAAPARGQGLRGPVHHPLGHRGRLPLHPGAGDVGPAGAHRHRRRRAVRRRSRPRAALHPRVRRPVRAGLGRAAGGALV